MKYKIGILKSENKQEHLPWVDACKRHSDLVDYQVIDLLKSDWIDAIVSFDGDCYLTRPSGTIGSLKTYYDERLTLIVSSLGKDIFPNLVSNLIYENKRYLAYWLQLHDVNHPPTIISMDYDDSLDRASSLGYPIVAKTSIGAGGSGVQFLENRTELENYCKRVFFGNGVTRKWGPNIRKGSLFERSVNRLSHPLTTIRYFQSKKRQSTSEPQRFHVIFQEYIESDYEWRIVRVGDSFFGHKKLKGKSRMFSGTSLVSWDYPDKGVLDLSKKITDLGEFRSMALDLLISTDKKVFVNELQCFWGSKNPHQMIVDGKPGRFINHDGEWIFQSGEFNQNNSYDLRLEYVLNKLAMSNRRDG